MKYLLLGMLLLIDPLAEVFAPQDPLQQWAVRFSIETKSSPECPDPPVCHISVLVKAPTEGQATVNALLHVQSWTTNDVQSRLKFYDICKKEK